MFYVKIEVSYSLRVKGIPPIILLTIFDLIFFGGGGNLYIID
jgi:hypothetical protein